jgi:hypothetical protein
MTWRSSGIWSSISERRCNDSISSSKFGLPYWTAVEPMMIIRAAELRLSKASDDASSRRESDEQRSQMGSATIVMEPSSSVSANSASNQLTGREVATEVVSKVILHTTGMG